MTVSIRRPFQPLVDGDPSQVGRYRLLARLGAGGFGTVYLGQNDTGELAAVKVVHPGLAADPTFRDRFRREVELGMRVNSQFTTRLLAADVDAPQPWMATEFVDGPSLAEAGDRAYKEGVGGSSPSAPTRIRTTARVFLGSLRWTPT